MKLEAHIHIKELLQSCAEHSTLHSKNGISWFVKWTSKKKISSMMKLVIWWDGAAVKSTTDCPARGSGFSSQNSLVRLSVTLFSGAPTPLFWPPLTVYAHSEQT